MGCSGSIDRLSLLIYIYGGDDLLGSACHLYKMVEVLINVASHLRRDLFFLLHKVVIQVVKLRMLLK